MKLAVMFSTLVLTLALAATAAAAPPEIANIFPDWCGYHHAAGHGTAHIITGEGFTEKGLEVWTLFPASDEKAIIGAIEKLAGGGALPELPQTPPRPAPPDFSTQARQWAAFPDV